MEHVITVEHLNKRYRDTVAVEDVSFSVRRGEIFGMLGPNGAGKTTTIECLQGLRSRQAGRVEVLGMDPESEQSHLRSRIGSQLQSSALPERLRVAEAIRLFSHVQTEKVDIDRTLAAWDLTGLARRPYGTLSGGQRQRLFLALALLGDPELVFLDELTAALDPNARRATWELVKEVRDRGATVVLVTHFMEEAEALCDRIAIVDEGRVIALDTPQALAAGDNGGVRTTFTADGVDTGFLSGLPGVRSVSVADHDLVTVSGSNTSPITVAAALNDRGLAPANFRTHHPSLEDAFLKLTGVTLNDEEKS